MQCRLPRMQTMISTVDVELSGDFDSDFGYVTIDGTQYTRAQTLNVAKGTSVTVYCSGIGRAKQYCKITLNGTTVAQGTADATAEYTFAVTANCTIVLSREISVAGNQYFTATITMPA